MNESRNESKQELYIHFGEEELGKETLETMRHLDSPSKAKSLEETEKLTVSFILNRITVHRFKFR